MREEILPVMTTLKRCKCVGIVHKNPHISGWCGECGGYHAPDIAHDPIKIPSDGDDLRLTNEEAYRQSK